jgi:UDPglucose 6-dehydrogenase
MKITVVGTGYVGLVTGTCLAEQGNQVLCFDVNSEKIDQLNAGIVPIYEPGLEAMVRRNRNDGTLSFTTDPDLAVAHGDVQFIAVGTPPGEDGSADLSHVIAAARSIGKRMRSFKVVVDKSTVPVGTADRVRETIAVELKLRGPQGDVQFAVLSNPEFLKEGAAVEDFMRPDRIIIGVGETDADKRAAALMRSLYAPFNRNHDKLIFMSLRSAEFTKYAANAMLATRISFMNELANLAEVVGADIEMVRQGIGSDPRIGYSYLYAGTGYGGSCFPKDVLALQKTADALGIPMRILRAVGDVNERQKRVLVNKIVRRFGEDMRGRNFALWGLAFKPNTDDMREAPSRVIVRELIDRGAAISVYDPIAMDEARRCLAEDFLDSPDKLKALTYADTASAVIRGADALIIATEWKAFRSPDFAAMKSALKNPIIFDGRNLYDPDTVKEFGFEYEAIGRPA